ncbi:MAG: hypothetical protein RL036_496 [Actinomycetota bacterium]|jgi:hypothetical protein
MKSALNRLFVALMIAFAAIGGQALLSASNPSSASADELLPGLTPNLRLVAFSGNNGFTVYVDNYDPAYSWTPTVSNGTVTTRVTTTPLALTFAVRDIPLGGSSTLTVTTSRMGYSDGVASVLGYARKPALIATNTDPVPTYGGYSIQITNFDPAFAWLASSTYGTAAIDGNGLVTVNTLGGHLSDTLVVSTTREGYVTGVTSIPATALPLQAALVPEFGPLNQYVGGFEFRITNYDPAFSWQVLSLDGEGGDLSIDDTGLVRVLNSTPATRKKVEVTSSRDLYEFGRATVVGVPLGAGLTPEFANYQRTDYGFTVEITNFDSNFYWYLETDSGAAWMPTDGLVEVVNLGLGEGTFLLVRTERPGYESSAAPFYGQALDLGLVATFGDLIQRDRGLEVQITNFNSSFDWAVSSSMGTPSISDAGLVTVSGLTPGNDVEITIRTRADGYVTQVTNYRGVLLNTALAPSFAPITRFEGGFRSRILNFSGYFTWLAETSAGQVTLDNNGNLEVTGLSPGQSATVTVSNTGTYYAPGSGSIESWALDFASAPEFSDPIANATGFTAMITNYAPEYAWQVETSAGEATIDDLGQLTVSGLQAGQSATVRVTFSGPDFLSSSSSITGSAATAAIQDDRNTQVDAEAQTRAKARADAEAAAEAAVKAKAEAEAVIRAKEAAEAKAAAEKAAKLEADRKTVAEALAKPATSAPSVIKSLTSEQVALIAPIVFKQLAPATVAAITPKQAASLTGGQVRALPVSSLTKLKPAVIGALKPEALAALPVAKLKALTKAQVKQIWLGQWLQLDADQRKALKR